MTNKLKIGFVLDTSLDPTDGVQQYVITVGEWLRRQGHEVHYAVGHSTRQDLPNLHSVARNVSVKFNGNRTTIPLPASRHTLRQFLGEHQFDVLHVQVPYSPFMAGRLLNLAGSEVAVVGSFHVLPYTRIAYFMNHLLALFNRRTAKRFDAMIANTRPTAEFARAVYGFTSTVIPNPFPLADFTVPARKPNAKLRIVFLGRLVARKGALQLLEAVARTRELTTVEFDVVVGGKGEQRAKLKSYAQAHGLADIVSFPGFVDEAHKASFLASADIAVFPSISGESFGISLLEALAATPGVVLAGDNPGYRSVMAPDFAQQLLPVQQTDVFAHQLAYWIEHASARSTAAKLQQAYVKQFDIGMVGPQVVDIYNQALRSRRNVR